MKKSVTVQARISPQLHQQAEAVFSGIGITPSEAIRLFFQQTVNSEGLPFRPHLKKPNTKTEASIDELETGGGEKHKTTDDLFDSWE